MSDVDVERSERLRSVDLTSGLDRVALARLAAYMDPVSVPAGEAIITEGETGDALYIIVRGTFAVLSGPDAHRLNTIGPGHYVGELALLVDEPRSATIRADTDGEVLRLERQQFMELLGRDAPAARAVATSPSGCASRWYATGATRIGIDTSCPRTVADVAMPDTSASTRGRSRSRWNAATFSRSVTSSPAPPAKYP